MWQSIEVRIFEKFAVRDVHVSSLDLTCLYREFHSRKMGRHKKNKKTFKLVQTAEEKNIHHKKGAKLAELQKLERQKPKAFVFQEFEEEELSDHECYDYPSTSGIGAKLAAKEFSLEKDLELISRFFEGRKFDVEVHCKKNALTFLSASKCPDCRKIMKKPSDGRQVLTCPKHCAYEK
ncbi:unnamed protein product [Cylicocyclus nassatus]|uniref:Uncharacterized protein n=1 Tax=Cylicocyclus nassatus TaxID=53992 RepID=A0AA36MF45_CYLNA|nr:unnamed protein product [Cylicocyclus nassatus]